MKKVTSGVKEFLFGTKKRFIMTVVALSAITVGAAAQNDAVVDKVKTAAGTVTTTASGLLDIGGTSTEVEPATDVPQVEADVDTTDAS